LFFHGVFNLATEKIYLKPTKLPSFRQFGTNFPPNFHQFPPYQALWAPEFPPPYSRLWILCVGGDIIKPARILLIENDEALAVKAAAALEEAGYKVVRASNALDGLKKLYEAYPDLIIMARELPMVNGEEPCLRIRQASYLPIVVLGAEEEAAEMLELGADAYMRKPPDLNELTARVHSLLRRKPKDDPPGGSPEPHIKDCLTKEGKGLNGLTPTEFRLASCLILNKGRLLGYRQLAAEVWGGKTVTIDTLHFYMRRLQQKLANGGIFMVRGVGYCFSGAGKYPSR